MSHTRTLIALLLACSLSCVAWSADPKIEETVVGPATEGGTFIVSKSNAHVAYIAAKGTRTVVIVDGVEGPVVDQMLGGGDFGAYAPGKLGNIYSGTYGGEAIAGSYTAVLFTDDGLHYAYLARVGNDYIVIHDGKEVGRGSRLTLGTNYNPLRMSPGGKHVYWGETKLEGARGTWRLFMDGKPGPWAGHQDMKPVFSPDDSRYAYTYGTVEDYKKQVLFVDGKAASYVGYSPQFTADSKILLTIGAGNAVFVEGKALGVSGISLEKITPGTVGSRYAVIMRKRLVNYEGIGTLYLDGKEVPGTDGAMDITFSPDGKRYALRCKNAEAKTFFMIIDGKRGNEYQGIAEKVYWTPDSSNVIYQINSAGRNFVVVNTEEFPVQSVAALMSSPFPMAEKGSRYAFTSGDGSNRIFQVIVDGKPALPPNLWPQGSTFTFSADGSRYAYIVNPIGRNETAGIVIDGTLNNELAISQFSGTSWMNKQINTFFQFSRDGKYLARMARLPNNTNAGLYINDKLVYPTAPPVSHFGFSPDSRHVSWLASEKFPDRPQSYYVAYVDGFPAVKMSGDTFQATDGAWDVGADGVLTFIAAIGESVKRFRITPASDMNIDKVINEAGEKQARLIAEAAAAKKQAEEEAAALATKKKADADALAAQRKADADAALAKRKADTEAANAAKAKARADAAAAKTAARQNK